MSYINKILVPTDFSEPAKNALNYSVALAQKTNAQIHLLHVYHIPVVDPYMPGDTMEAMLEETKEASERAMEELKKETGYPNISSEVRMGFATDDIIEVSQEQGVNLIIMGTTGASGLKEVFFGSVASSVMTKSDVKVLAIPAEYKNHNIPANIMYAADFTDNEDYVFNELCKLCLDLGSKLKILHIVSEEPVFIGESPAATFEKLKRDCPFQDVEFTETKSSDVVESIQKFAAKSNCDVIAMALHRRNVFERLFHKSKTKEMAHHSKIPLLAFHKSG